jgi:lysophospholipid acyltransferase (LPLAT)-like uncharacterized protein
VLNVTSAVAPALWRYLRLIGPTVRSSLEMPVGSGSDPWRCFRDLVIEDRRKPHFLALWTTDHLNLLTLAFVRGQFAGIARHLAFLVDDSLGGRVVAGVLQKQSLHSVFIRHADPAGRLRDLRALVELNAPLVLVVDGHGPYYQVGTGIASLAKAVRGVVWPCAARTYAPLLIPNSKVRVELPRPFSTIAVALAPPIVAETVGNASELADSLRMHLDHLRRIRR